LWDDPQVSTQRRYWLYQATGWGFYTIVSSAFAIYYAGLTLGLVIGYVLFFLYSIGLTDLFRREIRRHKWLDPPVPWIWPRLAGGVLLIAAIQTVLVVSIDGVFDKTYTHWPLASIVSLAWGTCMATGTWTGLYVRLTERRRREERDMQAQLTLREAELRALEYQINPHFLFNCLNSIRALVIEDPPRAQDMLTRLSNVFRHSLRHDRQHTVPLASEVEAVADYLAIEAVRFEERLRVEFAIESGLEQFPVPPMLLQTLVENAIKHGIAQQPQGGELAVRATREAEGMILKVENTGRLSAAPSNGNQLGLANARQRLQLLYGDRASVALQGENGRVVATLRIPNA
jgi:signal transduction histidine kinase